MVTQLTPEFFLLGFWVWKLSKDLAAFLFEITLHYPQVRSCKPLRIVVNKLPVNTASYHKML